MTEDSDMAEDPTTDYELALERAGLDCSHYGCWRPIRAIVLNRHGREIGVCERHVAEHREVIRWLES